MNKCIPGRTKQEYREANKEYYEQNKEHILEQQKEYAKQKVVCECGSEVRKDNLRRHRKSIKHLEWVQSTL